LPDFELYDRTGNQGIDTLLYSLVRIYEAAFPGRVRGHYLIGSHAEKSAVLASDINLAERAELRELCRKVLGFENHFLAACRGFLLEALEWPAAPRRAQAAAWLGEVQFYDPEIMAALEACLEDPDEAVRAAAEKTLERLKNNEILLS